jgi:hypothetical protein
MVSPLTAEPRPCTGGRSGCAETVEREMPADVTSCFDCRMVGEWGDYRRLPLYTKLPAFMDRSGLTGSGGGRHTTPWRRGLLQD